MHFCYIAKDFNQSFLWKILLGKPINIMEGHYVYPIQDLDGTGHLSHLFVVYGLYHHNGVSQVIMMS